MAREAARRIGVEPWPRPFLLADSNNTVIRVADNVVAKVGASTVRAIPADVRLGRELEIARHAAAANAPVVHPVGGDASGPHFIDGEVVTLWRYYEPVDSSVGSAAMLGDALEALHTALADFRGSLPSYRDKLDLATALLTDEGRTPLLADDDRRFLASVGRSIMTAFVATDGLTLQPLHGEPHAGNVLWTPDGPLYLDFEGAIIGPWEWDIAYLPPEARTSSTPRDQQLVALCERATSYCVCAWCWADPGRAREVRAAAEYHLAALKQGVPRGV